MTAVDVIKAKNAIIFKYTGIQLVPDDQIVEVEQNEYNLNIKGN